VRNAEKPRHQVTIQLVHVTNQSVMEITQSCVKARTSGTASAGSRHTWNSIFLIKPFAMFNLGDTQSGPYAPFKCGEALAKVAVSGGTIWQPISSITQKNLFQQSKVPAIFLHP
jgi:hypothetical protein